MTKCPIKPLYDNVVVAETTKKEESGLILPTGSQETETVFRVLAVGEGRLVGGNIVPLKVKVGDRVTFGPNPQVSAHLVSGKKYFTLQEHYIAGVIHEA